MSFIFKLLLNGLAVYFTAVLLNTLFPGIQPVVLNNYPVAIFVSVVIGLMNRTVRPILKLITFPINIVTLGLFGWIINGIVIEVTGDFTSSNRSGPSRDSKPSSPGIKLN
jgi:putative membrane protein